MKKKRELGMFNSDYVYMALSSLSPITHELSWGHYRVPIKVQDDDYVVFIGDNRKRYYTDESLPDFIKQRIGMIKASPKGDVKTDRELHKLDLFKSRSKGFEFIGWQASDTMFVVVLSEQELIEIGMQHDARS